MHAATLPLQQYSAPMHAPRRPLHTAAPLGHTPSTAHKWDHAFSHTHPAHATSITHPALLNFSFSSLIPTFPNPLDEEIQYTPC